ncbi:hypothetical protein LAD67_17215 [Escherichia coli]|nr:hypothetical protein [Escherichia coli]
MSSVSPFPNGYAEKCNDVDMAISTVDCVDFPWFCTEEHRTSIVVCVGQGFTNLNPDEPLPLVSLYEPSLLIGIMAINSLIWLAIPWRNKPNLWQQTLSGCLEQLLLAARSVMARSMNF